MSDRIEQLEHGYDVLRTALHKSETENESIRAQWGMKEIERYNAQNNAESLANALGRCLTHYADRPSYILLRECRDALDQWLAWRVDSSSHSIANARLIAAAPELLEALLAVQRLDYFQEHSALAEMARAAIKKATE